jgi:hypothetical protein
MRANFLTSVAIFAFLSAKTVSGAPSVPLNPSAHNRLKHKPYRGMASVPYASITQDTECGMQHTASPTSQAPMIGTGMLR